MKPYSVLEWASHPDAGNDDCITGDDYDTREEALAAFNAATADYSIAYFQADGPDLHEIRPNPAYNAKQVARDNRDDDSEWRREIAMQAGMAGGCDAYNEAMGYD